MAVIAAYIVVVFVLLRLAVPHMGFGKDAIPDTIPVDWQRVVDELNASAISDFDYLEKSFAYLTSRYHGSRIRTVTNFWKGFGNAFSKPAGFLPCNMHNHILRVMLVKGGRFKEADVKTVTMPLNLFIHQYLDIRVGDRIVHADGWAAFTGKKLGEHAESVM